MSKKRLSGQDQQQIQENEYNISCNPQDFSHVSFKNKSYYNQDVSQFRDNTDRMLIDCGDKQSNRSNHNVNNQYQQEVFIKGLEDTTYIKTQGLDELNQSQSINRKNTNNEPKMLDLTSQEENNKVDDKDTPTYIKKESNERSFKNLISQSNSLNKSKQNNEGVDIISPPVTDDRTSKKKNILYDGDDIKSVKLRVPEQSLQEYVKKIKFAKLVAKVFRQRISQRANLTNSPINAQNKNSANKQLNGVDLPKNQFQKDGNCEDNFEKGISIIEKMLKFAQTKQVVIQQHVKAFILKLKRLSKNRHLENLSIDEYAVMNDYTHIASQQKIKTNYLIRQLQRIQIFALNKFEWLNKHTPILLPSQKYKLFWDFLQIFYTISFFFFYSLYAFFINDSLIINIEQSTAVSADQDLSLKVIQFSAVLFLLDIFVNLNTAFYIKDQIVMKRKDIARKYMKSHMIFDLLSTLVLFIKLWQGSQQINIFQSSQFIATLIENILIYSRYFSLKSKRKNIESSINLKQTQKYILKLIDLLFLAISYAHIVSILWNQLAQFEDYLGMTSTWRIKCGYQINGWHEQYIFSIYWAVTTMSTVGYGDITPSNYIEAAFVTINMLMMSCVFAYIINNVGMILQEIDKSSKELNSDIDTILRYLNRKNVNITLRSRARHYLNFFAKQQKDIHKENEDRVFLKLSKKLRDEISIEINQKIINKYSVFQKCFSKQTLDKAVLALKEIHIQPNEVVFMEEQLDDQAIYFLQSGHVEIYSQPISNQIGSKQIVLKSFHTSGLFGEISFFSGKARTASARSLNLSTLYYIKRADFLDILSQNSEDFERFKMLEHQINTFNNISCIGIECYLCKEQGHIASFCKRSHYVYDNQFRILQEQFSFFQERKFSRRFWKKEFFKHAHNFIEESQTVKKELSARIKNFEEVISEYIKNNSEEEDDSQQEDQEDGNEFEEEDEDDDEDASFVKNEKSMLSSRSDKRITISAEISSPPIQEKSQRGSIFIKLSKPNESEQPIIIEFEEHTPKVQEIKQLKFKQANNFSFEDDTAIQLEQIQSPAFEQKSGDNSQLQIDEDLESRYKGQMNKLNVEGSPNIYEKKTTMEERRKPTNEERRKLMIKHKSKSIDKKIVAAATSPPKKRNSSIFSLMNRQSLDQAQNLLNNSIMTYNNNTNTSAQVHQAPNMIYNNNQGNGLSQVIQGRDSSYTLFSNNQPKSSSRISYHNQNSLLSQVERLLQPISNNINLMNNSNATINAINENTDKKKFKDGINSSDLNFVGTSNSSNLSVLAHLQNTTNQLVDDGGILQKQILSILKQALGNITLQNYQAQSTIQKINQNQSGNLQKYQSIRPSYREDAYSTTSDNYIFLQFDKMNNFKTFFTYNNPCKIIQDYKNKVYLINRQKKNKIKPIQKERQRRGNILENCDLFKGGSLQQRTQYLIEEKIIFDKPTFLSYGVAEQQGQQNPKIYYENSRERQLFGQCSIV